MSFLNRLKQQASALQNKQAAELQNIEANTAATEWACRSVCKYLQDLAKHLSVITPDAPRFSLDGKTPWPAMKLVDFRTDFRKKKLRDNEVFDYIAMGWDIVPKVGIPIGGSVSVNFPPDLERVKKRLAFGHIEHEQKNIRHPEKNTLQAICFEYMTKARGNVAAGHDNGNLIFCLANADGFGVETSTWAAPKIDHALLDELAKMVVAQPNQFR